jgi:hypothetical protein
MFEFFKKHLTGFTPFSSARPAEATLAHRPASGPRGFEPIHDVSLERYALLAALVAEAGEDKARQYAIARAHGLSRLEWEAVVSGWTERMRDPALQGRVAMAFMPLYQEALAAGHVAQGPMSLEEFVRITAEYSFRKDPDGSSRQIDFDLVLRENRLSPSQWSEATLYWSPKVNNPRDPAAKKFRELMQKESDRLFGIRR